MIKFPTTISEYTDGKLWYEGVDESIARRLLVGINKLDSASEFELREMYLAHYYFKIGNYGLAMALVKTFMLSKASSHKLVNESLSLMKKICIRDRDIEGLSNFVSLTSRLNKGQSAEILDYVDDEDISVILDDMAEFDRDKNTSKGRVVYNSGMAEYYQNGKLVFSVKDKNHEAFLKDSAARYLLADGQAKEALEFLSEIDMKSIKSEFKILCHYTYVRAYCMLEQYDEAYKYCVFLMQCNVYMPEMMDIMLNFYKTESPHLYAMKEFFAGYKHFGVVQLGDIHSIARDLNDEDLWKKVYANNPINPKDISEEAYIFKGILAFNEQDYKTADKYFKQATALYGHFGKSWQYRYFVECYIKKLKKNHIVDDMPYQLYTASIEEVYNFIDKKLLSKLKKCKSFDEFDKNLDENLLELDNMLSGISVKACDIATIVQNIYAIDRHIPARNLIKKVIVENDYNVVIRAICLANYMLIDKSEKIILGKRIYDNPFAKTFKVDVDGNKFPLVYGMAIFLALSMVEGIEEKHLKNESKLLSKIFSKAKGDYSQITPLSVFGVLLAFFSQEPIQYDKEVVRRREVKAFAKTFVNDVEFVDDDGKMASDEVLSFFKLCMHLA